MFTYNYDTDGGYNSANRMSNNAVKAYKNYEKPMRYWDRENCDLVLKHLLDQNKITIQAYDYYCKQNLVTLKNLLEFSAYHIVGPVGASRTAKFYKFNGDRLNIMFNNKSVPELCSTKIKVDFDDGYVHGTYIHKEFYMYATENVKVVKTVPFINGRIKGQWLHLTSGKKKSLKLVTINERTKEKKDGKH